MMRKDMQFRSDSKMGKHFEKIVNLYHKGYSTQMLAEIFNIDAANIYRNLKSRNIEIRNHSQSMINAINHGRLEFKKGKESHRWKGGKRKHSEGYILIYYPQHHRSQSHGYVPEHILVAEKKIGRLIKKNEVVHHLNYQREDNRPENLKVMTITAHQKLHGLEGAISKWHGKQLKLFKL